MSEPVLIVIISFFITVATTVIASVVNRRATFAKAGADSGDAAESLSNAAKIQIELYQKEIVTPMRDRIEQLTEQLSVVEEDRFHERMKFEADIKKLQNQVERLNHQVDFMKGELRRSDSALEHAIGIAQSTHPQEMSVALKMRRGEM